MKLFEYKVATPGDLARLVPSANRDAIGLEEALNKLGKQGWELVDVNGASAMYFKRELKPV